MAHGALKLAMTLAFSFDPAVPSIAKVSAKADCVVTAMMKAVEIEMRVFIRMPRVGIRASSMRKLNTIMRINQNIFRTLRRVVTVQFT